MNILSNIRFYLIWIFSKIYNILYLGFQWIPTLFEGLHYNIDHLPLHLLILSLLIIITIFIYIKLTYPFWSTQPVYHTYDFWRDWVTDPFIIQTGYPSKTRFYKYDRIQTYDFLELTDSLKKQTVDLIQSFSICDESALYMFHLGNLDTYMTGHTYPSFVSFYYEDAFIPLPLSSTLDTIITDQTIIDIVRKPIGCITSRSIDLYLYNNIHSVYFLDFITVHREKATININISRELIHTHEYNQRKTTLDNANSTQENRPPIQISLFKKETTLSQGIVPLVSYKSTMIYIRNQRLRKLPPHVILVKIHRRNIKLLIDFLEISKTQFHCFGIPETPNLSALIHGGILKVFVLQNGQEVYAAYFFRDSRTQFDRDDKSNGALLILSGSIRNTTSIDLFYMGYLHSLRTILRETDIFKLLLIEGISQNIEIYQRYILENIDSEEIGENPSAYYLYNYMVPKQPFSPESCFMVF
jgi:hypothetical protein